MSDLGRVIRLNGDAASQWKRKHADADAQPALTGIANDIALATGKAAESTLPPARVLAPRTLLLIDDVRLRRECLAYLLSAEFPDFEIVAVARTLPSQEWSMTPPCLVLVSVSRLGELPVDEIDQIGASASGAPLLLLSELESDFNADAAVEFGVAGVFPATCGSSLLIAAIQLVLAGGRVHIPSRRQSVSRPT